MPTELSYLYCTKAEIENIIGSDAYGKMVQDLNATQLAAWLTEFRSDATDLINTYCLVFYEAEDLANSRWVRTRAAYVAVYFLSQRRGNPALYQLRFEQIMQELMMVLQGIIQIPGLATRNDMTPAMTNLTVDDNFSVQKLRVQPAISTGGTYSNQHTAYRWPYEWL